MAVALQAGECSWDERGGPTVTSQTRQGFGTTLIEQSLKSEGGSARMSVGAGGVVWEIILPLRGQPQPMRARRADLK
jgi:two-component sensor histidine kinase